MEFVPYRLIRNEPHEFRKKLEEQGELVVTTVIGLSKNLSHFIGRPSFLYLDAQNICAILPKHKNLILTLVFGDQEWHLVKQKPL